jgi:hypothetical protein
VTAAEPLEWTCHVCHETRPDAQIAVLVRPGLLGRVYIRQNVRYCRDREACVEGAKTLVWSPNTLRFLGDAVIAAFPEEEVQRSLVNMVPAHLHDGIARYVTEGRATGDFLRAVFENDLAAAAQRADMVNRHRLAEIALFVTWHCPSACWGSPVAVSDWLATHADERARSAEKG